MVHSHLCRQADSAVSSAPPRKIWCPFDTADSLYVRYFNYLGYDVIHTHISEGQNFFAMDMPECDYIISNPPYSVKTQVLQRLFELGKPFAMLVGVVGLFESQTRFDTFRANEFEIMYLSRRVKFFRDFNEDEPSSHPPFSSVYICKDILPERIVFESIDTTHEKRQELFAFSEETL